jgi:hypothetical protein
MRRNRREIPEDLERVWNDLQSLTKTARHFKMHETTVKEMLTELGVELKTSKRYTPEEEETFKAQIKQLYEDGMPLRNIFPKVGVGAKKGRQLVEELGLSIKRGYPKAKRPDDLHEMFEKLDQNLSALERHYNISRPTLTKWLKADGLVEIKKNLTQEEEEALKNQIKDLYENQNKKQEEIWQILGIGQWLGRRLFDVLELEVDRAKWSRLPVPSKEEMERLYAEGQTVSYLANHYGVQFNTILSWMKVHGIEYVSPPVWTSEGERTLASFIETELGHEVVRGYRQNNIELDIFLPDLKMGFEFNGAFFHSLEAGKPEDYHQSKTDFFKEVGILVFHIWEWEWNSDPEGVKFWIRQVINGTVSEPKSGDVISSDKRPDIPAPDDAKLWRRFSDGRQVSTERKHSSWHEVVGCLEWVFVGGTAQSKRRACQLKVFPLDDKSE